MNFLFPVLLLAQSSSSPIAIIDVYGLRSVQESAVRAAIGVREGDPVPSSTPDLRARVESIPGVVRADLSFVCCAADGGTILYVGIHKRGVAELTFGTAPSGAARLPHAVVAAGAAFDTALISAVRRGVVEEDGSQGHSLMADSAARAAQQQFVRLAAEYFDTLRAVLRTSADEEHRALAAQVIAYAADKRAVVPELLHALADPAEPVRNNAVRALGLVVAYANTHPELNIHVPPEPFVELINSVVWTDRNKGSLVLFELTQSRDPGLLARLRREALPALVEMARWKNPGHAFHSLIMLGRIAGMADADIFAALSANDRESVIGRALASGAGG